MMLRYCFLVVVLSFTQCVGASQSFFSLSSLAEELAGKTVALIVLDVEMNRISGRMTKDTSSTWTLSAERNIKRRLFKFFNAQNYKFTTTTIPAKLELTQLISLQKIVEKSILSNFKQPLPTKTSFDWSIGKDTVLLKNAVNADFGLFGFFRGGFRQANESVEYQSGIISLVDLQTGRTVWFKAKTNLNGDFRDFGKASIAVLDLFESFPGIDGNL